MSITFTSKITIETAHISAVRSLPHLEQKVQKAIKDNRSEKWIAYMQRGLDKAKAELQNIKAEAEAIGHEIGSLKRYHEGEFVYNMCFPDGTVGGVFTMPEEGGIIGGININPFEPVPDVVPCSKGSGAMAVRVK